MKKTTIFLFTTILFTTNFAQNFPQQFISDSLFKESIAPCGISPEFLQSLDLSAVNNSQVKIIPLGFPSSAIERCGKFDIYYEDLLSTTPNAGFSDPIDGLNRRNTLCAVLTYIQSVFDFSNIPVNAPIRLFVNQSFAPIVNPAPTTTTFLAFAGPTFVSTSTPGIINGFVFDYVNTGVDPASINQEHAVLNVNFDQTFNPSPTPINWHDDYTIPIQNCQYDLYSILLHEIGHTLGWLSYTHNNSITGFPESILGNNQFSALDNTLHKGTVLPLNLNPLIVGTPTSPAINPIYATSTTALTANDIWINSLAAPDNDPVYSGLIYGPWSTLFAVNSILSHLDDQMWMYSTRARISPGDNKDYVMGPFGVQGILKRTFEKIEINTFLNLGYVINPSFSGIANVSNSLPYSTRMANYPNYLDNLFPETVAADFTIVNNTGSSIVINLSTDPTIIDNDGDPVSVLPTSLVNIRGCGNGGNNHNQLVLSSSNQIITYTPRPNFYGRAQFGFKLFDGKDEGSYVIYTIDVSRGTNVNCTLGSNLILNGDLEEGSEVKQLGANEVIDASVREQSILREGKLRAGIHFGDSHSGNYLSNNWGPFGSGDMIRNSLINCNGTIYQSIAGSKSSSLPTIDSAPKPLPTGNVGDRYRNIVGFANYFNLCSDVQTCTRYVLEFDYFAQPFYIANGTIIPLTIGFVNTLTFTTPPTYTFSTVENITIINNSWQHITIPFTYCGTTPSSILNLSPTLNNLGFILDNLVLREELTPPPPLTVNISPANPSICSGDNITLSSMVTDALCDVTYLWSTGATTATINVTPSATTTYTLTVNDGCRSTIVNNTVTVNPLSTISITPSAPTICSGESTNLAASGADTYTWSPATGLSSTSGATVIANPTTTTTYTATGITTNGCSATSSVTVTVDQNCGTCTTCIPLATSGTLSTHPGSGKTYCINNDITVTGNVNFISSEFKIASNVTITVDATATLNIYGSHLYACDEMWKGIVVKPGGKVTVQSITSAGVNRSSLIEDAFIAIDIPSSPFITNNPLMVRNATFNRNQVAIRISKYSKASGSTTYQTSVVNTVFTSRDIPFTPNLLDWPHTTTIKAPIVVPPLKSPYINDATFSATNSNAYLKAPFSPFSSKPLAGIILNKVGASIPVSSPTPTYYEMKIGGAGPLNFNVFDNLNIGIDAEGSNFTCVNNVFQNNPLNQKNGMAINAIVKEQDNNRLQVIPFANTTNKFYDVGKAVNTVNYFEHLITNCEVRSSRVSTAPSSPTFFNGKYGFYVLTNRFKSINLSTNTMYNIENGITFNANFGPYSVGGTVPNGQYSGQVDVNNNVIRPNLPTIPVTTQYVANAITVSNGSSSNLTYILGSIVNINNNALTDVYRGIASSTWVKKDVKINDNTITLVPDPFTVNPLQYGIGIQANRTLTVFGNSIAGNTVTGFGVTSNAKVRAIITSLCSNQLVRCNNVSKTYKGIEFNGDNAPTSFTKNNMQTHRYGLVLDNNSFIGVQGNSTSPTDNQWLGTWNVPDFKTATLGGSTAIGNTLWVRKPAGAFNPDGSGFSTLSALDLYSNANNTVLYVTNNPIVTSCTTLTPCCPDAGKIARMEQVVQDQDVLTNNIAETRYINKNKVHRMLRDEPSLLTESVILQDFYTQSLNTNRENFVTIEDDFAVSDIVNASAKTSSLLVENNIEQNYKTFFESYIKQQTDTITTTDSLTLVTLAMGCPFTDGEVVYQARVLFNAIYMSNVVFEDNCSSGNLRLSNTDEDLSFHENTTFSVIMYPNPTSSELTIELIGNESNWIIAVLDVQSRKVAEKSSTNNKINLKLELDNGVYFVRVTNSSTGEIIVKKLIINK